MNTEEQRRFSGVTRLYGTEGAAKIMKAHVVVVGIGGVGSWAAEALARTHVGQITLIDMDHIAQSNMNRQIHALDATLGQSKIQAMYERILQINPQCQVNLVDDFVTPENWSQLVPQNVNAVIDACDQLAAKYTLMQWAQRNQAVHFIAVGAAGGKRAAHLVNVDDLSQVTHDPLLSKLRYQIRKKMRQNGSHSQQASCTKKSNKKMGLTCVYSPEEVKKVEQIQCRAGEVQTDSSLNCHGYGSCVSVTATFGLCAAGWLLNQLVQD